MNNKMDKEKTKTWEEQVKRDMRRTRIMIEALKERGIETEHLDAWRLRLYLMAVRTHLHAYPNTHPNDRQGETHYLAEAIDLFLRDNYELTYDDLLRFAHPDNNLGRVCLGFKRYAYEKISQRRLERELI